MAPRRQKNTRRGDAAAGRRKQWDEGGEESSARSGEPPTERRIYARTPRTWEQWDEPLRQRVVGKRVVKWLRLRISHSGPQPDVDR